MDLPLLKHWQFLPSGQCLQPEAWFRQQNLFRWEKEPRHVVKSTSLVRPCSATSLTADDSQLRNRDLEPYGKNQFCIRYRRTGRDHILTVSQALIPGEEILNISALKVRLFHHPCRKIYPLYSFPTGLTKKKVVKGRRAILFPGSKGALLGLVLINMVCLAFFNGFQKEATIDIKKYSKEMEKFSEESKEKNRIAIRGLMN